MDMRHIANTRQEAVDEASQTKGWTATEGSFASRVWSRQIEGLTATILAEPPVTTDDVLAVLSCLAEARDLFDSSDAQCARAVRDLNETTDVAIQNCVVALAAIKSTTSAPSPTEQDDIAWSVKQVARWLPQPAEKGEG